MKRGVAYWLDRNTNVSAIDCSNDHRGILMNYIAAKYQNITVSEQYSHFTNSREKADSVCYLFITGFILSFQEYSGLLL